MRKTLSLWQRNYLICKLFPLLLALYICAFSVFENLHLYFLQLYIFVSAISVGTKTLVFLSRFATSYLPNFWSTTHPDPQLKMSCICFSPPWLAILDLRWIQPTSISRALFLSSEDFLIRISNLLKYKGWWVQPVHTTGPRRVITLFKESQWLANTTKIKSKEAKSTYGPSDSFFYIIFTVW